MRRWLRRIGWGLIALAMLIGLGVAGGYLWLRTGLPQTTGTVLVAGLDSAVSIQRDDRGVPIIRAQSNHDGYFALGFLHAQDRLFQMDAMRRLGAGRLSEIIGPNVLATDRIMRTLGLYRMAEAQVAAASPALRSALEAYAAGVNAYLDQQRGAWPPEFYLLGYRPEPWLPADSLVWGRLMALDLSGNWQAEETNRALQRTLPSYLFDLLVTVPSTQAAGGDPVWRQPLNQASNSWVIGPNLTASGKPIIANDPHLGLGLPATWYLARLQTPEMTWSGATAPGLPFFVIGSNGHVAWTFTTTHGDTQDLFEERVIPELADHYETPAGPAPFATREEVIAVKGGDDVTLTVRETRHGPVVSELEDGGVLALAWTALLPGDRTPEAIQAMNHAHDAAALEVALVDFHAPLQNIVFADSAGATGFMTAGRVPLRGQAFADSRLPAPGWTGNHDWTGTLAVAEMPQSHGDGGEIIVTANNDIRPAGYRPFITADWPDDARARQIRALAEQTTTHDLEQSRLMQMNAHSAPLLAFVRRWEALATAAAPELAAILADWDGAMDRDLAAPLIATLWLDRTARRLLGDEMAEAYDAWWFWQVDRIENIIADGRACNDTATEDLETCAEMLIKALREVRADLVAAFGDDARQWHWGDSHRARFQHPVFRNVPLVADWLDADLPTDGDFFTINRGTPLPPRDGVALSHVHGPGLRFLHDFGDPDGSQFGLAGGQSGHPLSPHYADWLGDWRAGAYRRIGGKGNDELILQPQQSAP
ncbi:MAG: penicillin acylase family protein [Rhodospirillaceae bacterium]|nr:penicillin acylase family protein [Rhodospirillaceae bacterium]